MSAAKSLTTAEITQVLDYIAHNANAIRNRALFLMSVLAGLRVSELAGLTIGDVRDASGAVKSEVYLAAHRVKHGHARTIYISTRLAEELDAYIISRNWIVNTQPLFPFITHHANHSVPIHSHSTSFGCIKAQEFQHQVIRDARLF
jgi:integrase/recombinase XerD